MKNLLQTSKFQSMNWKNNYPSATHGNVSDNILVYRNVFRNFATFVHEMKKNCGTVKVKVRT